MISSSLRCILQYQTAERFSAYGGRPEDVWSVACLSLVLGGHSFDRRLATGA
eukprot:COSAG06_NODE_27527_length_591_cov_1.186992_2_plen_51_part_01